MNPTSTQKHGNVVIVVLSFLVALVQTGCTMPYGVQFRETALPAIESGVQSILSGFVDGVFASIAPENDEAP